MLLSPNAEAFVSHPQGQVLAAIIFGDTGTSSAGFPVISSQSFQLFLEQVPHLFETGATLLDWLYKIEETLKTENTLADPGKASAERAITVLKTVVQTAAITAPGDLWLMGHVLSSWTHAGLCQKLARDEPLHLMRLASSDGLNLAQLRMDAHLLAARGVLSKSSGPDAYVLAATAEARGLVKQLAPLAPSWPCDWVAELRLAIAGKSSRTQASRLHKFLSLHEDYLPSTSWRPGPYEVMIGHRLLPIMLAYHQRGIPFDPTKGLPLPGLDLPLGQYLRPVLRAAGIIKSNDLLSLLGERVLTRGVGPFGIIHAYHPYFSSHGTRLSGNPSSQAWVVRADNIAASQDANSRTFTMINDALDRFVSREGFKITTFIEHAVGEGEALRQRYERSSEAGICFVGADLENAAIDRARERQSQGILPPSAQFIRQADIGKPAYLVARLEELGVVTKGAVMVVGNGFHEVRQQTNEGMIQIFRDYNQAGILLIFAEESALADQDLINTAWNTYNAGFRYVHEISGQGLRPAYDFDDETERFSWRHCAEAGGYWVHPGYTTHTRRIYPFTRVGAANPAISTNYFCIPQYLQAAIKST